MIRPIKPSRDFCGRARFFHRPFEMPSALRRPKIISSWPGFERLITQTGLELRAIHATVARSWRCGAGLDARTAAKKLRLIVADSIDDLRDLEERDRSRAAAVEQPRVLQGKQLFKYVV